MIITSLALLSLQFYSTDLQSFFHESKTVDRKFVTDPLPNRDLTVMGFCGVGALDLLRAFPSTAPLVRMILVITRDVGPFLGVCSIVIAGCTCFFAINQPEAGSAFGNFDGVAGFLTPLLTVTLAMLGSYEIGDYTKRAAVAMFLFFAFFVIILMLNLLIAIMGDAYSKVKESELVEGLHERATLIVEHELLFPWRQTYCRYLHVAEAVADSETQSSWNGLGGRIQALRRDFTSKLETGLAKVGNSQVEAKAGQAEVNAGQSKLEARQAEAKADMEEVKAGQAEMKAEMADMKSLLEKLVAQSLQNAA